MVTINTVPVIVADGRGVSVFTLEGIIREGLTGYAWRFKKGTRISVGLKLVADPRPEKVEHYFIVPTENMPVDKYKGLLEELSLRCEKYLRIRENGVMTQVG